MATSSNQPALVHKSLGVEGCKVVDDEKGIVEAYVSGIGNKDSGGDIIIPGAFNSSLQQRTPKGVWSHDWDKPVSKTLEIYEVPAGDPRLPMKMQLAEIGGLYVKTQFNLNTQLGRDAYETVKFFGEESEWSIGYQVDDAEYDHDQKAMILKEISLYEYSPVLFGMNELTSTVSIKAHKGDDGELEYEVEGLEEVEEKAVKAALDVIFKDKQMSADLEDYAEKPWHIEKRNEKYCVIKDSDGSNAGCHDTRKEAEDHMSALYASENGDEKSTEEDIEQKSEDNSISASVKWVADNTTSNDGYYQWTTTGTDWFKTGFGASDDSRITELESDITELKDLVKTLLDESREARKTDEDREFEAAIAGVELLKGLKAAASEKFGTAFPTEIKWEEGAAKFRVWDEVEAKEVEEAYSFNVTEDGIELTEKTDIFEEKVEEEVAPEAEEVVEAEEKAEETDETEEKVEEEVADEKTEEVEETTDEVTEEESDEKSDEAEETEEKVEDEEAEEKSDDDSEVEDSVEESEDEKSEEPDEIEHKEDEDDDSEFFRNLAEFEELLSD